MRRFLSIDAAILVFMVGLSSHVWAAKQPHRPWFMHSRSKSIVAESPAEVQPNKDMSSRRSSTQSSKIVRQPYLIKKSNLPASATGQKVVTQAMKYKGTKYVFGGTTKKGIDCSGFVMRVYHDVKAWQLPRTSADMYKKGQPIKEGQLRPGDLVFFKNTYKHGISHVGIYTGDNKFIHARNRRFGVTISKLSDPYFQLHYAGARRMI